MHLTRRDAKGLWASLGVSSVNKLKGRMIHWGQQGRARTFASKRYKRGPQIPSGIIHTHTHLKRGLPIYFLVCLKQLGYGDERGEGGEEVDPRMRSTLQGLPERLLCLDSGQGLFGDFPSHCSIVMRRRGPRGPFNPPEGPW